MNVSSGRAARTGRMVDLSTARLARVPAAGLAQRDPPPQVAGELTQLDAEGHGLVQVGEKIAD